MQELHKQEAVGRVRKALLCGLLGTMVIASGCETAAGTGALAGGALGAGIGGIAGGRGGALIGGALGAGTGLVAGSVVDQNKQRKQDQAVAAQVAARGPSLFDVADLTAHGVPEGEIINQIRSSGIVYTLTPQDLKYLNDNHVSPAVITEMQATAYRTQQVVVPRRVVVVEQAPPPPAYIGVGVGIR
jgi:hypothetical protein